MRVVSIRNHEDATKEKIQNIYRKLLMKLEGQTRKVKK